jgi:hypothetical protein
MHALKQAVEWVAGVVQTNSPKPQEKQSKASSKPYAGEQKPRPRDATSQQPLHLSGVTKTDGREWRTIGADARKAAENSSQTVSMLQDMLTPQDREGPNQIQEIQDNLAQLAEAMMRLEKKLDALLQRVR